MTIHNVIWMKRYRVFDKPKYRERNVIGRLFDWLKAQRLAGALRETAKDQ